jgi:hypothetical protein
MFPHAGAYGHQSSMSGSTWASEQDGDTNVEQEYASHTDWLNLFQTPPPDPTQDTQYHEDGSEIPARNVGPPHRYGWTTPPNPPPQRRGRRRG